MCSNYFHPACKNRNPAYTPHLPSCSLSLEKTIRGVPLLVYMNDMEVMVESISLAVALVMNS